MNSTTDQVTLETTLMLKSSLVLRQEEEGSAILYDSKTGSVRILNLSATEFCKALDGRRTVAQVIAHLRDHFDHIDARAEEQVLRLARDLHGAGLLIVVTELTA